jgi:hypothetical protein
MRTLEQLVSQRVKYKNLSQEEKDMLKWLGILNGYWPSGDWLLHKILKCLTPAFSEANSYKHDWGFYLGWDLAFFHECNSKFFYAMVRDAMRSKRRMYYLFMACMYYMAVELKGKKYFNFREVSV